MRKPSKQQPEKATRTREEYQRDYERVCQTIGDRVYRIRALEAEVTELVQLAGAIQKAAAEGGAA